MKSVLSVFYNLRFMVKIPDELKLFVCKYSENYLFVLIHMMTLIISCKISLCEKTTQIAFLIKYF